MCASLKQAEPQAGEPAAKPRESWQGLRMLPMEADRTLSLLSLSGRSRGGLITIIRTLVCKYLGRNNKPGT